MFTKFSLIWLLIIPCQQLLAAPTSVHTDGVLGTSLDVSLYGSSESKSHAAIDSLLKRINRLEGVLSTWRKDSEISQLNINKASEHLSTHLHNVLTLCQQWEQSAEAHFSCRLGQLTQQWKKAVAQQQIPDRIQLRRLARDIRGQEHIVLDNQQAIVIPQKVTFDISAVAKGYILDDSVQYLRAQLPTVTGIKLNIGGDIITWGHKDSHKPWQISISPHNKINDNNHHQTIEITHGAIAHSGIGERDFVINRRQFNHILSPQEGWPLDNPHTVTVYALSGATADAVATALNTMEIPQAIDYVNKLNNVEALIQTTHGKAYTSAHWHQLTKNNEHAVTPTQLRLDYQIPDITHANYERPYLSFWLTDNKGLFLRQVLLLGDANRWAQENTRWWRTVGRKQDDLLDASARPTRRPGHYMIEWNGYDFNNHRVTNNNLVLHMEASRENGGHNYRKTAINLNDNAPMTLPQKGEIGMTTVTVIHQ